MDIRIDGSDVIQHGELYGMSCVIWMNFMACGTVCVCACFKGVCVCVYFWFKRCKISLHPSINFLDMIQLELNQSLPITDNHSSCLPCLVLHPFC